MARRIEVEIVGDSRSLERAFARSEKSAKQFDTQVSSTGRNMRGLYATAAGVGITAGIKTAVIAASDLDEQLGKTRVVFGQSSAEIEAWSKTTTTAFGLSRRQALETASGFGALFAPLGIVGDAAAEQSRKLTELGADLASFYNTDVASALDAIRSGLVGESEPLRRYGVLLSEARVQAQAMADTGKKTADSLTAQEKVAARVALIYQDTAQAQGDAERSSDRLAQKTKVLQAQTEDLSATLGEGLIPGLVTLTDALLGVAGAIGGVNSKMRDMHAGFLTKGILQQGGLLDALGLPHFGGGQDTGKTGTMLDPLTKMIQAAAGGAAGGVGKAANQGRTAAAAAGALQTLGGISAFIDKWAAVGRKGAAAQKAAAAAARAAEQYQTRMDTRRGWLDFGIERAGATKKLSDDRAAYKALERYLQERIRHEGRTLELVRDLWRARQAVRDLNKKKAKDGDPLAGLMQASTKQLTNILAAGTGLTGQGRGRLAYNIAGAELVVHSHVHLDGHQVATVVNRHNAKAGRRTAAQTSGRRG